jgi:tetratricopeptide (TPR) repeat protein
MALAVCFAGCGTSRVARKGECPGGAALTEDEFSFARALAHYTQGLIHESEQGWGADDAQAELAKAIELDPARYRLYARTAAMHLYRRCPESAIAILQRACQRHPDMVQAWMDLAVACEAAGQTEKAVAHYRRCLDLSPSNGSLYGRAARLHFRRHEDDEALRILSLGLSKAEDRQPVLAFCYHSGLEFVAAREVHRAIRCFEVLLRHEATKTEQLHLLLGELNESLKRGEEALNHFRRAAEAKDASVEAHLRLAAYQSRTDAQASLATLKRAGEIFPADPRVLFSLGLLYSREREFARAIDAFQAVETSEAGSSGNKIKLNEEFYLHYGAACEQAGRIDEAAAIFERCIAKYPDAHAVRNYLAYMWAEKAIHLDEALAHIQAALKIEPDNGAYVDTLGWIYYRQKRYPEALEQIRRANDLIRDDATICDHLGDVHAAMNRRDQAVRFWKESLRLKSDSPDVIRKLRDAGIDPTQKAGMPEERPGGGAPGPTPDSQ